MRILNIISANKIKAIYLIAMLFTWNSSPSFANHQTTPELKIGVLAKRGEQITVDRWTETASYLSEKLSNQKFSIVPLGFDEIDQAVDRHQIDFLLTNPGMFVDLSFNYELFALATLKRNILGQPFTEFGSVIFTRNDNTQITHLSDLAEQDIAAVNENSLGGWIAAYRELDSIGIGKESFHSLRFLGTHDKVVYAVANNMVDVGIVRTDTLERMQAEGKINLSDFQVLPSLKRVEEETKINKNYPLQLSTRLYPEWPLASLPHISENIAERVSAALIVMRSDSRAAIGSRVLGWTIPRNYREVDLAFGQLKLGYYQTLSDYSFLDVIARYWKYLLIALLSVALLDVNTLYIVSVNKKLGTSQKELQFQATHDALTGLPNRILFYELANRFLHIALRDQKKSVILFLDLDHFKTINDTHGHDIGDFLLKKVSHRMSNMLRDNDIIARIGGDEFLIMLSNIDSVKSFESIMQRLIEVVTQPLTIENGLEIDVGCSLGAAHYPKHGSLLKELIKKADSALYQAKNSGRGKFVIYDKN